MNIESIHLKKKPVDGNPILLIYILKTSDSCYSIAIMNHKKNVRIVTDKFATRSQSYTEGYNYYPRALRRAFIWRVEYHMCAVISRNMRLSKSKYGILNIHDIYYELSRLVTHGQIRTIHYIIIIWKNKGRKKTRKTNGCRIIN